MQVERKKVSIKDKFETLKAKIQWFPNEVIATMPMKGKEEHGMLCNVPLQSHSYLELSRMCDGKYRWSHSPQ